MRAALLASVPLDADGRLEAHVDVGFWGRALTDERLRAAHEESYAGAMALCREWVAAARTDGAIVSRQNDETIAEQALLLVDALSAHALLYPRWDATRLRTHIDAFLAGLGPPV